MGGGPGRPALRPFDGRQEGREGLWRMDFEPVRGLGWTRRWPECLVRGPGRLPLVGELRWCGGASELAQLVRVAPERDRGLHRPARSPSRVGGSSGLLEPGWLWWLRGGERHLGGCVGCSRPWPRLRPRPDPRGGGRAGRRFGTGLLGPIPTVPGCALSPAARWGPAPGRDPGSGPKTRYRGPGEGQGRGGSAPRSRTIGWCRRVRSRRRRVERVERGHSGLRDRGRQRGPWPDTDCRCRSQSGAEQHGGRGARALRVGAGSCGRPCAGLCPRGIEAWPGPGGVRIGPRPEVVGPCVPGLPATAGRAARRLWRGVLAALA